MKIEIPGYKELDLRYLVLDYNGTIAMGGKIKESVKERIRRLAEEMEIVVLTADTYGTAEEACRDLPVRIRTFPNENALPAKMAVVEELGLDACAAIGNGRNDKLMLRASALAVAVIEQEGMCGRLLNEADVCARSIEDALDLFLYPVRLVATLRG